MSRRHLIIPGTDGLYSITEDGEVYSEGRSQQIRNKWGSLTTRHLKGRKMRQYRSSGGYPMADLSLLDGKKKCLVHRLVAETFLPNPDNLAEVNHKDGNKSNNLVDNLEWCSRVDNIRHNVAAGGHGGPYGKQKLSLEDRERILESGSTPKNIAKEYGICEGYAYRLLRGIDNA